MARLYSRTHRRYSGFTLIESAMVTVIIGVGVVAVLQLLAAGTLSNNDSTELTTGLTLARNVRELALGLSFADPALASPWDPYNPSTFGRGSTETTLALYDDLDDLHGITLSPPVDARRQTLSHYAGWSQAITVRSVDPDRLTTQVPNGTSPAIRMTVVVRHNGQQVCELSWVTFCTE